MLAPSPVLKKVSNAFVALAAGAMLLTVASGAMAQDYDLGSSHHSKKKSHEATGGDQVYDVIGDAAREMAIIFSQPNISQSAYSSSRYPIISQQQSPTLVLLPAVAGKPALILVHGKVVTRK